MTASRTPRIRTHWEDCEQSHHECALAKLEAARKELSSLRGRVEVDPTALRLAKEMVDQPDARAQIKVKLAAMGLPMMADVIDEAVLISRELIRLSAAPLPKAKGEST